MKKISAQNNDDNNKTARSRAAIVVVRIVIVVIRPAIASPGVVGVGKCVGPEASIGIPNRHNKLETKHYRVS